MQTGNRAAAICIRTRRTRTALGRIAPSSVALFAVATALVTANDEPVPRSSHCVTEGAVAEHGHTLLIDVPKMRAHVNHPGGDSEELLFTYLGAPAQQAALGSGAVREQLGLKLRAADACNLVYVMWRLASPEKLVVPVSSTECGNRGYRNVKPRFSTAIPHVTQADTHRLGGSLGPDATALQGPAGVRSDNVRPEFELNVARPASAGAESTARCPKGAEQSD